MKEYCACFVTDINTDVIIAPYVAHT